MRILIIVLSLIVVTACHAQKGEGIHFETAISWSELIAKAKKENKNIFIDCYATWCGPCKLMDQQVYPAKEVGDYFNSKYISARVQMDKTDVDDSLVKEWYSTAANLKVNYSVNSFPTFLFFSPEGLPMHKTTGSLSAKDFIQLGEDALNPDKQYYSVLKNFQPGKIDTSELKGLARSFRYSDKALAGKIAEDYFNRIPKNEIGDSDNVRFMRDLALTAIPQVEKIAINYLKSIDAKQFSAPDNFRLILAMNQNKEIQELIYTYIKSLSNKQLKQKNNLDLITVFKTEKNFKEIADSYITSLSKKEIFKKDNLEFMSYFLDTSASRSFHIFFTDSAKVNKTIGIDRFSLWAVRRIITKEEITPYITISKKGGPDPDFEKIQQTIESKYGAYYARFCVNWAMPNFYSGKKDWKNLTKSLVAVVEFMGLENMGGANALNNFAWGVFQHSQDRTELEKALLWSQYSLKLDSAVGSIMDANWAMHADTYANLLYKLGKNEEAIKWEEKAVVADPKAKDFSENLDKMRRGEKTWPDAE